MVKEDIETVLDLLLDYVDAKGEVTLKQASEALGKPPAQIEHFAAILEESGLLELEYSLTEVKLVSVKKRLEESSAQLQEQKPKATSEEAELLRKEILSKKSLLGFLHSDLERATKNAEYLLKDLESRESFSREELDILRAGVGEAVRQLGESDEEIEELGHKEREFYSRLKNFMEKINRIKPVEGVRITEKAQQTPRAEEAAPKPGPSAVEEIRISELQKAAGEQAQAREKPMAEPSYEKNIANTAAGDTVEKAFFAPQKASETIAAAESLIETAKRKGFFDMRTSIAEEETNLAKKALAEGNVQRALELAKQAVEKLLKADFIT